MPLRPLRQPRFAATLVLAACATSCGTSAPPATVTDLSWACGERRCTASFRVESPKDDDRRLLVLVRAYAGDTVADRKVVGEHKETASLAAGHSRRFSVAFETRSPASRLRVILEPAD
jgi:hypothetical protein